jgi:predicted metal-dependent phosphoesterase TrpH
MIDLHTHSTASDGSYTPTVLITEAAKCGLSAIALTDHDTIAGLEEAALAAAERGIHFVHGVELEIAWNQGGEFHLLGLGLNSPAPGFKAALEELARRRLNRNMEMIERMNKAGISVLYDDVISLAGGLEAAGPQSRHSIGRPHFAAFLVKKRIVKNREQAFRRYLGKGKPFYIPKAGLEFEKAVEIIRDSGGVTILAHPMSLYTAWGRLPGLIKDLQKKGLDGLEAWHPNARVTDCKRLDEIGKKLGLYVTAGSDFHGEARPGRKLGITAGGKKIEESFLELPPFLK